MSSVKTGPKDLILRIIGGPENNTLIPVKTTTCKLAHQSDNGVDVECTIARSAQGAEIVCSSGVVQINGEDTAAEQLCEGDLIGIGGKKYEVFQIGYLPAIARRILAAQPRSGSGNGNAVNQRIEKIESELGRQSENFECVNKRFDELSQQLTQLLNAVSSAAEPPALHESSIEHSPVQFESDQTAEFASQAESTTDTMPVKLEITSPHFVDSREINSHGDGELAVDGEAATGLTECNESADEPTDLLRNSNVQPSDESNVNRIQEEPRVDQQFLNELRAASEVPSTSDDEVRDPSGPQQIACDTNDEATRNFESSASLTVDRSSGEPVESCQVDQATDVSEQFDLPEAKLVAAEEIVPVVEDTVDESHSANDFKDRLELANEKLGDQHSDSPLDVLFHSTPQSPNETHEFRTAEPSPIGASFAPEQHLSAGQLSSDAGQSAVEFQETNEGADSSLPSFEPTESLPNTPVQEAKPSEVAQQIDREAEQLATTDSFGEDASRLSGEYEEKPNDPQYEENLLQRLNALTAQARTEQAQGADVELNQPSDIDQDIQTTDANIPPSAEDSAGGESNLDQLLASLDSTVSVSQTSDMATDADEPMETTHEAALPAANQHTQEMTTDDNASLARTDSEQPLSPEPASASIPAADQHPDRNEGEANQKLEALFASLRAKDNPDHQSPDASDSTPFESQMDSQLVDKAAVLPQPDYTDSAVEPSSLTATDAQLSAVFNGQTAVAETEEQIESAMVDELEAETNEPETKEQESVADLLARMNALPDLADEAAGQSVEPNSGEASIQQQSNAVDPEPESESSSDRDGQENTEDVQDYMNSLLQRLNGGRPAASATPAVEVNAVEKEEPAVKAEKELVAEAAPLNPEEYVPKQVAPELSSNLAAMRELANATSRKAVETSVLKKKKEDATAFLIAAGGALMGAVATSFFSKQPGDLFFYVAIGLFLTTAVCSSIYAKSFFAGLSSTGGRPDAKSKESGGGWSNKFKGWLKKKKNPNPAQDS